MSKTVFRVHRPSSHHLSPCQVLHVDFGSPMTGPEGHKVRVHTHAFWQMEIVHSGEMTARCDTVLGTEEWLLNPGDAFLIPPGVPHSFDYPPGPLTFHSYKFGFKGNTERQAGPLVKTPFNDSLMGLLRFQGPRDFQESRGEWIAHILAALMCAEEPRSSSGGESLGDLVSQIKKWSAEKAGQPASLKVLASDLGYSSAYLSAVFKKNHGSSLKRFLDAERAAAISRLLKYADLRISEISQRLGFPDVLTFSHFCRKHLGKSPRHFRKEMS